MGELKPCPLCGGVDFTWEFHVSTKGGGQSVKCSGCGTTGPSRWRRSAARAAWNTRAPDAERDSALADSARLRERVARLQAFHDAWVETEVANAIGEPDLAAEKRRALIGIHHEVHAEREAARAALTEGDK